MQFKVVHTIDTWDNDDGEFELYAVEVGKDDRYLATFTTPELAKEYAQKYKDGYSVEYFTL